MKSIKRLYAIAAIAMLAGYACGKDLSKSDVKMTIQQKIERFSPTRIYADTSRLSAGDKMALGGIIEAARLMDQIFLRQVWSGNPALLAKLISDKSAVGKELLHYYQINMGPWSLLDHNDPFIEGVPKEKPAGANYYPEDMTKEEFNNWFGTLPGSERERASGFFSVIRRDKNGKLAVVPYSNEYRKWLEPAAKSMKEAAGLTDNLTLKKYLETRGDAFLSDDYYASDVAWMELDSPIDLTIGPYETYMDDLFGYKAAFEVYVTLRDDIETAKLEKFSGYLQDIENHLPMDPKYRNPGLGAMSPIRVVDVLYSAGEGNRGVQTAAFNLPNDEKVVREKGSKRVMLKNMQEAKFNKILTPISGKILTVSQQSSISFEAFFTHILAHELMHGLGPHEITVNGKSTNVRQELKELYSAIEEAKADITGLFALQYLIDNGYVEKSLESKMYTTFLASMFRSVRFGINEAHGKGVAIQFNFLVEEGAIKYDGITKTFSIVDNRIKSSVEKLTGEILILEAEGSYLKAKKMIDKYVYISRDMQAGIDKLDAIPVDIKPEFIYVKETAGAIR